MEQLEVSSVEKQVNSGVAHLEWLVSPVGPVALEEGQFGFGFFDSTSLNLLGDLNHIILTLCHIFSPVSW